MRLIFVGPGYPRKLFNLEHFPIYGTYINSCSVRLLQVHHVICDVAIYVYDVMWLCYIFVII